MKKNLHRIHALFPLSWQGLVLGILLSHFVISPIKVGNDVVLSVVTFSLIPLICIVLTGTMLLKRSLMRSMEVRFDLAGNSRLPNPYVSRTPLKFTTLISGCRLLPFFSLELRITWNGPERNDDIFSVSSFWDSQRLTASKEVTFPHRGRWHIAQVSALLRGPLRLTRIGWRLPLPANHEWEIGVSIPETQALPLVTSATQPGDAVIDQDNRKGDYYDLKPYHPSDGLSRIVWKIYAKSNQLVSRKPEAASTPEGRMLIYLWALPEDDELAGVTLRYLKAASNSDVSYNFGCLGMGNKHACNTFDEAQRLIIDSVWNSSNAVKQNALENFLNALPDLRTYESINLFCDESHFSSEENLQKTTALGNIIKEAGLQPIFMVPRNWIPRTNKKSSQLLDYAVKAKLINLPLESPVVAPQLLAEFERICTNNRWKFVRS